MNNRDEGDPLYLNVQTMLANKAGFQGVGLAMDLIMIAWWPTKSPFTWDEERLCELLNSSLPARGYTAEKLRQYRDATSTYFTVLQDGRWAPSPEYFSMVNGNPGSES